MDTRVLCPKDEVLDICLDKRKLSVFLSTLGVKTPRLLRVAGQVEDEQNWLDDLPIPCVVKPSGGQGTVGTFVVRDRSEIRCGFQCVLGAIVQEYVEGDHCTIDVFGDETGEPI